MSQSALQQSLLVKHDVSRLPVTDGDRIVGIVDRHDVLRGLA